MKDGHAMKRFALALSAAVVMLGACEGRNPTPALEAPPVEVAPGEAQPADTGFEAAAAAGWRCFRRALDRCVHYAECRACTLAHQIT
jgi:hypothetical protein